MGYWHSYHYLSEILKSPERLSKLFKRHFFTLVYLPSSSSCSTKKLAFRHGRRIHHLSGSRIGFLFLHEDAFESHEGHFRQPSVAKSERRWQEYFGGAAIDARVFDLGAAAPVVNSRSIAGELGIVSRMPCILVICHHFSDAIYTWSLTSGDADEVASVFDRFCSAFYDSNSATLTALDVVEEALD